MTEVDRRATEADSRFPSPRTHAQLSALRLTELREIAASLGLGSVSTLRKGPLVDAISTATTEENAIQSDSIESESAEIEIAEADTTGAKPAAGADEPGVPPAQVEVLPPQSAPAEAPAQPAPVPLPTDAAAAEVAEPASDEVGVEAPKSARDHTNQGLTGIAEDLQELRRRETGEPPAEGQHDGTVPIETAGDGDSAGGGAGAESSAGDRTVTADGGEESRATEQGEGRRGRGRGRNRAQADRVQGQQQAEKQGAQQSGQQVAQKQVEPIEKPDGDAPQRQQGGQQNGQQSERQQQDGDGRGRGRYRDRKRRGAGVDPDEPEISDDDVLIPIAGILDVLDNYAFVRTSGYLPGPNDVYVSLGQVKKYALRKGDAVVGAIRQLRDGESGGRQKYNAIVKVDSVNGLPVNEADERVEFGNLTPLYPQERLRLETDPQRLSGRIIDLVAPIGKGQRGLIVSPPKAGKTLILQSIAGAIATNNPEVHLMVVLVDERPEEVTEMQRSVKGEVIASTFDRPAEDHTTVAELAIERAKRLVELGYDVVVLLDSITRLSRAYNVSLPASGHVLPGGVDVAALHLAKRVFGAARNIENGGSLTILATALVQTGSVTDEVILEEFKGTDNMELRLSRDLADKRVFPAVDVAASGTHREEMLMGPDEVTVTWQLRHAIAGLDTGAALEVVLNKLRETATNVEFLVQMQKSLPAGTNGPAGRSE